MSTVLIVVLVAGIFLIRSAYPNNVNRKTEIIFSGITIFLYAALRDQTVGVDLPTYYNNYIQISSFSVGDILFHSSSYTWSRDPFFWIFIKSLTYFSASPQLMIITISAIIAFSISQLIYRSGSDVLMCFLIFICLRYFSFTLTGLRQAMAMAMLFFTFKYLESKKPIPFIMYVFLASAFHASALIFLVAYPLALFKRINVIVFISITLAIVSFFFQGLIGYLLPLLPFLGERFSGYAASGETLNGFVVFSIYFLIFIMIISQYKNINIYILNLSTKYNMYTNSKRTMNPPSVMYTNFFIVGTALASLGLFVPNLFRIAYFFILPSLLYLFPKVIGYYNSNFRPLPIRALVIILLISQFLIIGPGAGTANYHFFWQ